MPIEITTSDEMGSHRGSLIKYIETNVSDDIKTHVREIRKKDTNKIEIREKWKNFLYRYENIPFLNKFEKNHGRIKENIEFD